MGVSGWKRVARRGCGAAAAIGLLLYGGAAAAGLSVCVDTSSSMHAVDTALAQAVAKQQGAALKIHEYNSRNNDDVNGMSDFDRLVAHDCDLVLGFPLDTDAPAGALGDLEATRPYAHTAFVLVVPASSKVATLAGVPDGSRVAVTYMTPPNLYFATHPGWQKDVELHDSATLEAVAGGKAAAALVWAPAVVQWRAGHPGSPALATHPIAEQHATFNLIGLYAKDHAASAAAFDRSIAALTASGELQRILGAYAEAGPAPATHAAGDPSSDPPASSPADPAGDAPASGARPALYTAAQATAGRTQFLANCAMCHGPLLEGMAGPALKGPHFAPPSADFHVHDIFSVVANEMPATQPGSLPRDTYVEIMAFLLQENGYPAGSQALTYDEAMHSTAMFISEGK